MVKGLSPLVATVLLIAITIALSNIIMSWMTTLAKEETQNIGNKTSAAIDCTSANIDIRSVYLDFGANISTVIVWNNGQVNNMKVTSAQIFSTKGEALNRTNSTEEIVLNIGEVEDIKFNMTNLITQCSNFSQAFVTTNCVGISDKFTATPYGC
ncbi:MAG: hypothetical protein J4473_02800 [Candidatus Aenigmarchaeota archaeon]|nr:hypothetical protein [Candidatus Aenigmarchaeota archaeon]